MGKKRKKKKDAGAIIFRLIGIEMLIVTSVMVILGVIYVPTLLAKFGGVLGLTNPNNGPGNPPLPNNQTGILNPDITPTTEGAKQSDAEPTEPEEEIASIRLVSAGDNLMYRSSTLSGKHSDGSYSYYDNFCNVQDIFQSADIAVLSQDTVMAGEAYGYTVNDVFTTVTQVGDSIVSAGIDIVLAANNHILDQGVDGLNNMINYWKTTHPNIALLGVNKSAEEQDTLFYIEKEGIKIAVINYTSKSNYTAPLESAPYLLNMENEQWLTDMIAKANEEADFVIVYPHWGTPNSVEITLDQERQAQMLADMGADLVIGGASHVIEPVRWVTGKNGNHTLVYYSLGNFQSVQDSTANMLGGLAEVTITKTNRRTYISACGMNFVVTHYAKQPQSTNDYFDVVTTFPWSQYNAELAAQHGILAWDPQFSYEKLEILRRDILNKCDFNVNR